LEWSGVTLYDQIEENDVSRWVDRNSISGVYPARLGWIPIGFVVRGWFGGTEIGCGGSSIPRLIYEGRITMDGLSREEILRQYQSELIAEFDDHFVINAVWRKWIDKVKLD
jgi:hypothetical protein